MKSSIEPARDFIDRRHEFYGRLLDWCLDRAARSLRDQDDRAAANWLLVAARSAYAFSFGQLACSRLESLGLEIAGRLDPVPQGAAREETSPRRWLHVMSIGRAVGGHTTMLRRWVESDHSHDEHHLVLTFMDQLALPELRTAIEQSGGRVTALGGIPNLLERARRLRDVAWRHADRVVIHHHPWDVVPLIAFGVAGGPPTMVLNHSDHTFWVGVSIADLVINLRQGGQELTRCNRGSDRNFLFRIPLPDSRDPVAVAQDRASVRTELGIPSSAVVFVTVGSGYKYKSVGDLDFLEMARSLLTKLPSAYLVAVGPSTSDIDWHIAARDLSPRLIPLGEKLSVARYQAAADIYLEGFPFDSHTALLEAAVSGLPVVRIPACAVPPFSGHHFPLSEVTQPDDVSAYLDQAISLANSHEMRICRAAKLHDAVLKLQCGSAWQQRLSELKRVIPRSHALYALQPVGVDRELARFWTAFLLRVGRPDPLCFVLKLAREWQLDPSAELHPILVEYGKLLEAAELESSRLRAQLETRQVFSAPGQSSKLDK